MNINRNVIATFVLLTFGGIFLYIGLTTQTDFVSENLSPEFVGVALELIVVIWFLDYWQQKKSHEQLTISERRLREYLIFFLKHNFRALPKELQIGRFFGKDHEKNKQDIDKLIAHISKNGLSEAEISSIQEHCIREFDTLNSLLPVASQLSNDHFKSWARIVHFVSCIVHRREPVSKCTKDILNNIKRFDTSSFNSKIFVN